MTPNFHKPKPDHKQRDVTWGWQRRGFGFAPLDEDVVSGLERCPKCGRENYYACVTECLCAWCGWRVEDDLTAEV